MVILEVWAIFHIGGAQMRKIQKCHTIDFSIKR
jgi:hypothetical protein